MSKIRIDIAREYNITKSPFEMILYVWKDDNYITIEDPNDKIVQRIPSYKINEFIRVDVQKLDWKRIFDNSYITIEDRILKCFTPLYDEKHRNGILTFYITSQTLPYFKTKMKLNLNGFNYTIVDNSFSNEEERMTTFNYQFQNIKDFEVENFKIEMADEKRLHISDENDDLIKRPKVTCRLPMFQMYTIFSPYGNDKIYLFTKIGDDFYRFPYGNVSQQDSLCMEIEHDLYEISKEYLYANIVTSQFNGDFTPHIRYDNKQQTTLDIDLIREKVDRNESTSFIDILFYLSQCENVEDINMNIFFKTPNIPIEILSNMEEILHARYS